MNSFVFHHAFIFLISFWEIFADTKCDGKGGVICCFGYTWNEANKNCSKCDPGYFGVNCSKSCPYPNYGEKCKHRCLCNPETCDHVVGCVGKTDQIHVSSDRTESFASVKSSLWSSYVTERTEDHGITTESTRRIRRTNLNLNFTASKMLHRGTETLSPMNTEAMIQSKNIEKRLDVLMNRYEKDKIFFGVMQKLQIGMTIMIVISILMVTVFRSTRKQSCKYWRPNNKTAVVKSLDEEDHYHRVEDSHHILRRNNDEGFLFHGLAEVKFDYDEKQNRYTMGFQPSRDHKGVDDQPQHIPRQRNMQGKTTYYVDPEVTNGKDDDFAEMERNSFQDQVNIHEQCGYIGSTQSLKKGDTDPYLSVVS